VDKSNPFGRQVQIFNILFNSKIVMELQVVSNNSLSFFTFYMCSKMLRQRGGNNKQGFRSRAISERELIQIDFGKK
jgi:chloramphenicol O-acetyltransferase